MSGSLLAAQPVTDAAQPSEAIGAVEPTLNLNVYSALHPSSEVALLGDPAPELSSSSSLMDDESAKPTLTFVNPGTPGGDPGQPPPYRRRRYGRPSYSDRWHNADGSNRLAFVAGGGFNIPVGDQSTDYLKTSWRVEGGAGVNFSRKFGVILQFDWDKFGLPGKVLVNQETLYNGIFVNSDGSSIDFSQLDGNSHIWSFTLNPTFTFYDSDKLGAYAVVGGGFYHKVTNFTLPQVQEGFDYFYGPYEYEENENIDTYTSNAPGVTGGVGLTYKFSRFANQKFFVEARYVHTFNQVRYGDPTYTGNPHGTPFNFYPPNSNETSYIPITFGIRF